MTIELWMLVSTAVLAPLFTIPILMGRLAAPHGMDWGLGNRDTPLEVAPWVDRAVRAHSNLIENLPVFASLVLVAHVIGCHTTLAVAGAVTFFAARVAHAIVYVAGIKTVRTIVFVISVLAETLILIEIARA